MQHVYRSVGGTVVLGGVSVATVSQRCRCDCCVASVAVLVALAIECIAESKVEGIPVAVGNRAPGGP